MTLFDKKDNDEYQELGNIFDPLDTVIYNGQYTLIRDVTKKGDKMSVNGKVRFLDIDKVDANATLHRHANS